MAIPERDTVNTTDRTYNTTNTERSVYTRESSSTGWFVGIIVALALLAIAYLVFSANSGPGTSAGTTTVDVNNTPAVTAPADAPVVITTPAEPAQMEAAPAPAENAAPMIEAAPAEGAAAPANDNAAAPAAAPAPAAGQ